MTPAGAADGRGLAFSGPSSPPLSEDPGTRLAAARAALGASVTLDAEAARVSLGDGDDGEAGCALDRAMGGGLARDGLHEIVPRGAPDRASAFGFALALAARLAAGRAILWIGDEASFAETGLPYAPGLDRHGLPSRRVIAVRARDAREALWALEEAVKSGAAGAAVGEIGRIGSAYDLTASRRLALAARAGGTPCLLLLAGLTGQADALSSAAMTRFEIAAAPSRRAASTGRLPLPGPPCWEVRLAKRHGGGAEGFDEIGRSFRLAWRIETGALRDDDAAFVEPRSAASGG
jgi:hypothetical protein